MSTHVTYRSAVLDDIPAVLALWERAAQPRATDNAAALRLAIEHDAELVILAIAGGAVVGTLVAGWDGWRGNMYRLAVDPDYRRRGIAEELVHRAEDVLRLRGAQRITSLVLADELAAARFWQSVGYESDPSVERHAKNLGD